MSVAVRCPSRRDTSGVPDMPVVRIVTPITVVIKVIVADHVRGHILCSPRVVVATLARVSPVVKVVLATDLVHLCSQGIRAAESPTLARVHIIVLAITSRLTFTLSNGDSRVISVIADVNSISARLRNDERLVRRVNLKNVISVQASHAHIE